MTNQQGAPEALRLADLLRQQAAYHREVASDCDMRAENTINWGHGEVCCRAADELLRLHAYCQELEAQVILDCMTHGQQSAEIEHVVGDVSKNGAESNMAQQPAPSAAHVVADALADSQYLAGVSAGWNAANADDPNSALQKLHESRAGYLKPLSAPKPSPTPQADSQPAPDEIINMAREQGLPETEIEGVFRVNVDDLGRMFNADRAARAPADSVTAPAAYSGNLEQELAMLIRRIVSSARRNCEDGSNVLKLANEAWVYLVRKGLNGSPLRDAGIESDPTPPAQAADSVLEDAARWFAERDNVLQSFWVLLGEAEAHADNDNNPLLKHQVEGFYRQWNALNGTTLGPRWVTRAARKQGGA